VLRGGAAAVRVVAGPEGAVGRRVAPWIRREPVIAVALVSVAFAAVLLVVTGGDSHRAVSTPPEATGPVLSDPQRLGPGPGADVDAYLAEAEQGREALNTLRGTQRVDALIDLTGYITPSAVTELLAATPGVDVLRGFARVAPPQAGLVHVLITSDTTDLAAGLEAAHSSANQIALHYERQLDRSLVHPSTRLQEELQAGADDAAAARIDAAGLAPDCGCVFALVVRGPAAQLQQLADAAAVRVLDPAPVTASLDRLMVVPLEPQVTETVPPLEFAGN
jgi:hypothetical protein